MFNRIRHLWAAEDGQSTVETAFGIASLVTALLISVSALVSVATYLSITDAAGSIARAAARGDAETVAAVKAAADADVSIADRGGTIEVTIRRAGGLIPVKARVVAAKEPVDEVSEENSAQQSTAGG